MFLPWWNSPKRRKNTIYFWQRYRFYGYLRLGGGKRAICILWELGFITVESRRNAQRCYSMLRERVRLSILPIRQRADAIGGGRHQPFGTPTHLHFRTANPISESNDTRILNMTCQF
jgi:hypothetical protein